jgi:hypothetical protein
LALTPDGTLALLLARMCLRNNAADTALGYLRQAQTLGLASSVLAPRYAEVAFLMKRFDAIAPLLAQAGPAVLSKPGLDAVVQFWSRKGSV